MDSLREGLAVLGILGLAVDTGRQAPVSGEVARAWVACTCSDQAVNQRLCSGLVALGACEEQPRLEVAGAGFDKARGGEAQGVGLDLGSKVVEKHKPQAGPAILAAAVLTVFGAIERADAHVIVVSVANEAGHGQGRRAKPYFVVCRGYVTGEACNPRHFISSNAGEGMGDKYCIGYTRPLHPWPGGGGFLLCAAWHDGCVVHARPRSLSGGRRLAAL